MSQFEKDNQGVKRCQTVKDIAVENVKGDPSKGYHYVKARCNKPAAVCLTDNREFCASCDKGTPDPNARPRVTNAAGTMLTKKELEECGVKDGIDPSLKPAPITVEAEKAVEAKVEAKKDEVVVLIPLAELAAADDVTVYLIRKVIDGFGTLPTPTYAESKRVMKLEEKLEALLVTRP